MPNEAAEPLIVPAELHPAQAGFLAMGQPVAGHVAATFVDLARRGAVQFAADKDPDHSHSWVLTASKTAGQRGLLGYEKALLGSLDDEHTRDVDETDRQIEAAATAFRRTLIHDAVHRGWLRHVMHGSLTDDGETLAKAVKHFRSRLRAVAERREPAEVHPWLPYLIAFGLPVAVDGDETTFASAVIQDCLTFPELVPPGPKAHPEEKPHKFPDPMAYSNDGVPDRSGALMAVYLSGF